MNLLYNGYNLFNNGYDLKYSPTTPTPTTITARVDYKDNG